jgi:transcriptional regulator with XRE-family HTH domain
MTSAKAPGPTVRRRQLGLELRRLREAADITREEAAQYIGVKSPTISRIELGRHAIRPANIKLLLHLYRVESPASDALLRLASEANQRGWWTFYGETVPDWFSNYVGLEADAAEIWSYESEFVPGLFQTTDYARAITAAAQPDSTSDDIERYARFRQARQERLTGGNPPKLLTVINEAVIRRTVGGADVMSAQLRHLLDVMELPHVTLQVLPFDAGAHAAMTGAFIMLRFPEEEMSTVYVENDRGGLYQERPADLDRYRLVWEQVTTIALQPDDTADMISRAAADLEDRKPERGAR